MLRLRTYKSCDAEMIASFIKDETTYNTWGGDHFGPYPITASMINTKYFDDNGDCQEDNFYPFVALDDDKIIGSFIIRYINNDPYTLRFGWVIVDPEQRKKGYGKRMLTLGLQYAFDIMKANKVTIGVFANNQVGYHCYKGCGFKDVEMDQEEVAIVDGEKWNILELELTKEEYYK